MMNTNLKWSKTTALALVGMAFAACSDEPVEPDEMLVLDMALIAADATIEDLTLWSQPLSFSAPTATSSANGPQMMPGEPGGRGGFSGTFSGTRSVTFFDENGDEQDGYDALTTASIVIEHEIEGEVSRDGWTASVYRERLKTVSGMVGEEVTRTWNGTGSEEVSRSMHLDDGTERSYESEGTVEYTDVVVPVPGSDPRWPLSGTIARAMTATRTGPDGTTTRSVQVVITFNGTQLATVSVNGVEMEIDLAERVGRNPIRRRDG